MRGPSVRKDWTRFPHDTGHYWLNAEMCTCGQFDFSPPEQKACGRKTKRESVETGTGEQTHNAVFPEHELRAAAVTFTCVVKIKPASADGEERSSTSLNSMMLQAVTPRAVESQI